MTIRSVILFTAKKIFIPVSVIVCGLPATAQNQLKGKVISEETQQPVPGVSVYLNNTTNGSVSDKDGIFYIRNVQPGKYRLVASSVGYTTYTKMIDTRSLDNDLIISLKAKADELQSVDVVAYDPEGWEKWGKLFTDLFIGTNPNAIICRLLNPEVIQFRMNSDNTLTATAKKPLKIENDALGY